NDGQNEGAGDRAARVLHLTAEKTHVVIAPIVVRGDEHGSAHSGEEFWLERERTWREVEGTSGAEMCETGEDDPCDRNCHAYPEQLGQLRDRCNAAIQQEDDEGAARHGDERSRHQHGADFERTKKWDSTAKGMGKP